MLSNKVNLFALGLEFNKIGSTGAAYVLNSVKKLKTFEKLYLNSNDIKGPAICDSLIDCLSQIENLKELRLSNNKLGDEGGKALAAALRANKSVRICHVSNNKLSAEAAKEFASLLEFKNTVLRDLDLSSNLIIMEELQILADAFKESSVECLNLRNNLISAEEILAFDSVLAFVANLPKRKFLF